MSSNHKQILVLGLKASISSSIGNANADTVRNLIQKEVEKAAADGYEVSTYLFDIENKNMGTEVREHLRSRQWDGVATGYGVRGNTELTHLFEDLVNAVLEEVKPPPKMIFQVRPDALAEATKRVMSNEGLH